MANRASRKGSKHAGRGLPPAPAVARGEILRTAAALVDSAEQLKSDAAFIGELAAEVTGDSQPEELEHAAAGLRAVVESAAVTITAIANGAGRLAGIAAARTTVCYADNPEESHDDHHNHRL